MGKSAGKPPDYVGAAEATARGEAANLQTQIAANRPNVQTAFGGQSWVQGPDGQWTMRTSMAPGLQGATDALQAQVGALRPLDPSLNDPVMSGDAARNQAIQSAMDASSRRLDPMFAQRRDALGAQLANQGLDPNSAAYRNAMGQLGMEQTDANQAAMSQAIAQGTAAGATALQGNLASREANLANALRFRQAPLAELGQIQGLAGNFPGFNPAGMARPTDYLGAANASGQWNIQNADMQNRGWGSALSALGSLAGAAAMFSDERLKDNVERHPVDVAPGVPLATWTWKGDPSGTPQVGVIAQDAERAAPETVSTHPSGFKQVHYAQLLRKGTK